MDSEVSASILIISCLNAGLVLVSVQYLSLMKELGESVPDAPGGGTAVPPPASLVRTQQYSRLGRGYPSNFNHYQMSSISVYLWVYMHPKARRG